jgi:hypothetical protein
MKLMDLELLRTSPIIRGWLDDHDRQVEAEARAEGRAEAKVEAKAEGVLRILGKRSVELTGEQRERIGSCTDPAQLDAWFDAALDATSADELFR